MTISSYGDITLKKEVTIEAIENGKRTTVVETDDLGELEPEDLGSNSEYGTVISSSVSRSNDAYDIKTTVYEDVDKAQQTIRLVGVGSEEPIETHPAFVTASGGFNHRLAGTGDNRANGAKFESEENDAKFTYFPPTAEKDLGGVESYLVPSVIMEVTKKFNTFEEVGWSQVYDIGKIKAPPTDITTGSRNWLLVGVQYNQDNNGAWSVTNQYQLSGPKGWNPYIYLSD